jgi:predicted CXXCH cytochrome family protein
MKLPVNVRNLLVGTALALAATACVRDGTAPAGVNVRDAAFIGYSNPDTKQTTCGNCHVLKQTSWAKTGHANAWADLQASGHASAACNKCHTTSGATNVGADTAGFFSASESSQKYYRDVQCEACHGPGQLHVTTPDETQPVAYFATLDSARGVGCGQCHSGPPHNPFFEDWSSGAHGEVLTSPAGNVTSTAGCPQCHEGKTAMKRFGGSDVFVENGDATLYPIGCTTCHNPHGSDNAKELRASISVRDTTNLCIQCHKRRSVPDLASASGPHSPQGPTFLGTSGWRPAGFAWDSSNVPTHSDLTANPTLCATCHVATFDVNGGNGQLAYHYTGHKFYAAPCVDGAGLPDTTNACAVTARNFSACATSGCHASQAAARTNLVALQSELTYYANVLWTDVNANGKIDAGDTGLLTRVPATEFKTRSATSNNTLPYTVAEGARFNVQLIASDRSNGAHNPPYMKSLMIATIQAVQVQYSLSVSAAVSARIAQQGRTLGVRIAAR